MAPLAEVSFVSIRNVLGNDEILAWSFGGLDLARFNKEMCLEMTRSWPGALEVWIWLVSIRQASRNKEMQQKQSRSKEIHTKAKNKLEASLRVSFSLRPGAFWLAKVPYCPKVFVASVALAKAWCILACKSAILSESFRCECCSR